ncbi:MAG: (deoxy)nucleoside triphosphate pyrophosphohydrolase [Nitrospinota bacterium]|nr:MAG: (deoxy)nucleoside triphosphate pyrophosphohydrolase [Nitrospinota bacterium]
MPSQPVPPGGKGIGEPLIVTAGILWANGRICICQRRADGPFPLQWEFPGGKVEEGEELAAALQRELAEELGIEACIGPEICRVTHRYPDGPTVHLVFFLVRGYRGEMVNQAFASVRWVTPEELSAFDFLEADREVIRKIAAGELLIREKH